MDLQQHVLESLRLLVPREVGVAEGELALHRGADAVRALLRPDDRHVRRVGQDLEPVHREADRLAADDCAEQVTGSEAHRPQRPRLRSGRLFDRDVLQAERRQAASHEGLEVRVVRSVSHDERHLDEDAMPTPALDEKHRREDHHLEDRQAQHGGGWVAHRDHPQHLPQARSSWKSAYTVAAPIAGGVTRIAPVSAM